MTVIRTSVRRMAQGAGWAFLAFLVAEGSIGASLAGEPSKADRIAEGREIFLREWVPGDPRSHGGDGLGPLYNDTSCVACHNLGAPGGGGPASKNAEILTLTGVLPFAENEKGKLEELHPGFRDARSVLLHRFGTDESYRSWRLRRSEGDEFAKMAEVRGPVEMERIKQLLLMKDPLMARRRILNPDVSRSQRNPLPLFGVGLIDAIPVELLRKAAVESGGHLNYFADGTVGRFGWKSQTSSLKKFVEAACAMELGLEVPTHHQARPPLDFGSKKAVGLDLTQEECYALTAYVAALPAPVGHSESPNAQAGRDLFTQIGCAGCHRPTLGAANGIYSDLSLHKMGDDLADSSAYYGEPDKSSFGAPTGDEWRTPPLWGFRDSGPYLHDGRADTLELAVAFHGGKSESSAKAFFKLSLTDRLKVQTFLNSLAAPTPSGGR